MVDGLEIDDTQHMVYWKVPLEKAKENQFGWQMLENNKIEGILPFEYYYIDDGICFQYPYHSLQRVTDYFQSKKADYDTLYLLCEGILRIIEQGEEYLLEEQGYLLTPEWIFWNHYEKEIWLCYLPGKDGDCKREYTTFVEYLLRQTDHTDKQTVRFIYDFYDFITSENFVPDMILRYLQDCKTGKAENTKREEHQKKEESLEREECTEAEGDTEKMKNPEKAGCISYQLSQKRKRRFCGGYAPGADCRTYTIHNKKAMVGRMEENEICIPFATISKKHAMLLLENEKIYVTDMDSHNGTFLNGKKIPANVKMECKEDDILTFADISYQLSKNG